MMMWKGKGVSLLIVILLMTGRAIAGDSTGNSFQGKKILWVDSYHQGYEWSDGIEHGIRTVLKNTGIDLEIFRMNTKLHDSVEYGRKAGLQAWDDVQRIKPDLVIATDDNSQKYLVVPFLKNTDLPVVFSGVNWDASMYGYPCRNVTGMVEVDMVNQLVKHLHRNARGDRIGYLSADVETERKISVFLNKRFFDNKMKVYLAKTFEQFKQQFLRAQTEVDMLMIYSPSGISGWEQTAAETFLVRNTRIPTGAMLQHMEKCVVYTMGKYPDEQGEYAAKAALKILSGAKVDSLPVVMNKKAKLTVNLKMAKAAHIILPVSVLKTATVIGQEAYDKEEPFGSNPVPDTYRGEKVLWVDSYNKGYEWSDGIEKGIQEVLAGTGIDLKIVRMDTKRNDSVEFGRKAGIKAENVVTTFRPDIVIASDDNAQKYLVVPYLKKSGIPVVFCGVNWDASMYGYPTEKVTGMVEVELIKDLVGLLRQYAKGDRIGYLCGDVETERKVVGIYNKRFFKGKLVPYYARTMTEFQRQYLLARQEVDMLVIPNHAGIAGWDAAAMEKFLRENAKMPTGGVFDFMSEFVVFTLAKYPEEQGNYAARTALRILNGTKPADIPIVANKRARMTVNLKMADAAGIVVSVPVLQKANKVIGQDVLQR